MHCRLGSHKAAKRRSVEERCTRVLITLTPFTPAERCGVRCGPGENSFENVTHICGVKRTGRCLQTTFRSDTWGGRTTVGTSTVHNAHRAVCTRTVLLCTEYRAESLAVKQSRDSHGVATCPVKAGCRARVRQSSFKFQRQKIPDDVLPYICTDKVTAHPGLQTELIEQASPRYLFHPGCLFSIWRGPHFEV